MAGLITKGVPLATYRGWDGFGSSDLKAMRIGPPALVKWRREQPEVASDAMRVGTAAHCRILEPAAYASRFVHKPDGMSFATKEGKEWKANVCDGAVILTHDEWELVDAIVDAFAQKPTALESLAMAKGIEDSLKWNDPDTGLPLKARPDWYDDGAVVDLKITRHASAQSIAFRAYTEGWAHQLAHYWSGLNECGHPVKSARLVAINPMPPQAFRVYCVELKQDALGMLHLENERTIAALAECHESGRWEGAPDEWTKIDLPSIAMNAVVDWGDEDMTPETAKRR